MRKMVSLTLLTILASPANIDAVSRRGIKADAIKGDRVDA
jgi:hypothetical protein